MCWSDIKIKQSTAKYIIEEKTENFHQELLGVIKRNIETEFVI